MALKISEKKDNSQTGKMCKGINQKFNQKNLKI